MYTFARQHCIPCCNILIHSMDQPKALVILLAHLGATESQMKEYSRLYTEKGCSTITAASPPIRFLWNRSLQPTAIQVLHHTIQELHKLQKKRTITSAPAQLLSPLSHQEEEEEELEEQQQHDEQLPPVVVHLMSNGGAFLWEEIEQQIRQSTSLFSEPSMALLTKQLSMGYQFWDSCPCYIYTWWDPKLLQQFWSNHNNNMAFPHPHWSKWFRSLYTGVVATALSIWCLGTLSWHKPQLFWQRMVHSGSSYTSSAKFQIFFYTTTDLLTDATAIDQFIGQQQQKGIRCTVHRFNTSNHCQFIHDHPEEYNTAIENALATIHSNTDYCRTELSQQE